MRNHGRRITILRWCKFELGSTTFAKDHALRRRQMTKCSGLDTHGFIHIQLSAVSSFCGQVCVFADILIHLAAALWHRVTFPCFGRPRGGKPVLIAADPTAVQLLQREIISKFITCTFKTILLTFSLLTKETARFSPQISVHILA